MNNQPLSCFFSIFHRILSEIDDGLAVVRAQVLTTLSAMALINGSAKALITLSAMALRV